MKTILVKNASIIDVESGDINKNDIYIENGIVKAINSNIKINAENIIEAEGILVTSGWVDAHAHVFHRGSTLGVDPNKYHLNKGVTCVIDQGSSGAANYNELREHIFDNTVVDCRAFLNCSKFGISIESLSGAGELSNLEHFDERLLEETYKKYSDEILGLKIRLSPNVCPYNVRSILKKATELSMKLGVPLEVHPNSANMSDIELFSLLKKNDIYTHMYHNSDVGILDEGGNIKQCAIDARKRGVIFDVGHGSGSLSFDIMKKAISQGFKPDIISTDLHNGNINGPVFDMATTMSKFLCAGLSLQEVLHKVTSAPVQMLGIKNKATSIMIGEKADITGFILNKNGHIYMDAYGKKIEGDFRILTKFTILCENIYE